MRILVIDSTHHIIADKLKSSGFVVDYLPEISEEDIVKIIGNYQGIILRSKIKIDQKIINCASGLKFIGRLGAGMEGIDAEYAGNKGIKCFNSPEGNRDAVGEHTLGMLLSLFNNLNKADSEVKNGVWLREVNRGREIMGKAIGIIGYGNMGSAFARRLKGFEARVTAYDKYKTNFSDKFVSECTLAEIFENTDILSLHIPLTDETTYMINDGFINRFKKNITIINTARGKCLKTEDLVKNMKSGKVTGACLDVLEYESASFGKIDFVGIKTMNYLKNSNRVILTPHIAGWTHESNYKMADVLADKIIEEFLGKKKK